MAAHVTRDEFADREKAFAMMREARINYVRCDFDWTSYQHRPTDPIDFSILDRVVDDAAKYGIKVLPILHNPPSWARPITEHLDAWRALVRQMAQRFKGRISVYEIWNEENLAYFWPSPNAAQYTQVLKIAYEEIKAADPTAKVAFGGTGGCDLAYIGAAYQAGARDFFDIMTVHPYTWPNAPDKDAMQLPNLRALMTRNGDAQKPIWLTEIGWPTHQATIPTPGVLLTGLKLARPEKTTWRVGCVSTATPCDGATQSAAEGIAKLLGPGSVVRAYSPEELNLKLAANELDVVIYPFDESFPLDTVKPVARFIKRGGILIDFGGFPMFYPRKDGKQVDRDAAGKLLLGSFAARLRMSVYGASLANGLTENGRAYPSPIAVQAGLNNLPDGVSIFRFFNDKHLQAGDELIPILTMKGKDGKEGIGAGVYKFNSDLKGAIIVCGSIGNKMGCSEQEQANHIRQLLDTAAKCNIQQVFLYEFRAPEKSPFHSEDHFGIVHRDFSPKPAYQVLKCRP